MPCKAHWKDVDSAACGRHFSLTAEKTGLVHQQKVVLNFKWRVVAYSWARVNTIISLRFKIQKQLPDQIRSRSRFNRIDRVTSELTE